MRQAIIMHVAYFLHQKMELWEETIVESEKELSFTEPKTDPMDVDSNINDKTKSNNAEEVEQAYNRRYWNEKYEATVLSALATFRI